MGVFPACTAITFSKVFCACCLSTPCKSVLLVKHDVLIQLLVSRHGGWPQVYVFLLIDTRISGIWSQRHDPRDGWHRRMSLRGKAKAGGPSVLMSFHLVDIRLCHPSWPSQSRRRTSPRRMSPRERKAETDAPDVCQWSLYIYIPRPFGGCWRRQYRQLRGDKGVPHEWRNQFWQSLEEGAEKWCSESDSYVPPLSLFLFMVRLCCLMSSDVGWHIRDKVRPMPRHGSILLYVHGNQKAR